MASFTVIPTSGAWGTIAGYINANRTAMDSAKQDLFDNEDILSLMEEAFTSDLKDYLENSAQLDSSGQLTSSQIPDSLVAGLEWIGTFDIGTDSVDDASSDNNGNFYKIATAGTESTILGESTEWLVGDWLISNGTSWERVATNVDSATTTTEGTIQLNNNLGGTSSSPKVTGLQGEYLSDDTPSTGDFIYFSSEDFWEIKSFETILAEHVTGAITNVLTDALSASIVVVTDSDGNLTESSVTATEVSYLSGVTSAVQTQLDAKQATITGAASTITDDDLTSGQVVVTNASGKITYATATSTELSYIEGLTSNAQDQIDGKQDAQNSITASVVPTSESVTTEIGTVGGVTFSVTMGGEAGDIVYITAGAKMLWTGAMTYYDYDEGEWVNTDLTDDLSNYWANTIAIGAMYGIDPYYVTTLAHLQAVTSYKGAAASLNGLGQFSIIIGRSTSDLSMVFRIRALADYV